MAHKNSLLTKRREPKPTNSACAEFANQNAGFIGGKTFQGENRQTIPRIRLRRILKFCAFAKKNAVSLTNQGCKGCQNVSPFCLTTLQKVEFPCFFKSSKTQALCHNQKQTIQEFGTSRITLLCLCREKRCLFGKSKLQRRQKQSSVPRKINFHQIPGSLSPIFHIFKNKKLKGLIFGVNL